MTTRILFVCDRCGTNDVDQRTWAKLSATHYDGSDLSFGGMLDLCPLCTTDFREWLGASKGSTTVPGRAAGGYARAANLTAERRREISQQAALARWNGKT